jgi:peptidoglycan/xylan/chitin deacetylase (PgdA/CDA1 family)
MKKRVSLFCFFAVFSLAGCNKIRSLVHRVEGEKPTAAEAAATPRPKAEPVATPEPIATPAPATHANKNATVIALCYHNIDDTGSKALTISIEEFDHELKAIKDNGFTVIPMQDFLAWRRGEKEIPAKSLLITIDDGWVSAYDNAWPLLKKYGYPFTLFIYINYVGTGGRSMTWDQLAEMRDAGVDIESHTYSHSSLKAPGALVDKHTADLVRKDVAALGEEGWLRKEIIGSKNVLEKQLAIKVNAFAYPFGKFSDKARQIIKEAGYEAAFTVYGQQLHASSPYDLLGRYAVEAGKPQIFADAMKMIGGGVVVNSAPEPDVAQLASASMITQPMDGETIKDPKPVIKANLATMGAIDTGSVEMRVSGFGLVAANYDEKSKTVSYQVSPKLRDKNYTVIISAKSQGKRVETRWSFNFDPTGKTVGPAPTAPLP